MKTRFIPAAAIALTSLTLTATAVAQVNSTTTTPASPATQSSPGTKSPATTDTVRPDARATGSTAMPAATAKRRGDAVDDKDRLENVLKSAANRGDYAKMLEKEGYRISAINSDKPEYLEYEIVKGDTSYEVQLDFDDKAPKATKIDVTANMWRADSTKKMMKDPNHKSASPMVATDGTASDRRYQKDWDSEKEKIEKAMKPGQSVDAYKKQLADMGYKITSVNDKEKDYVEYEIVKGQNSYEVQIDLDEKTRMGKEIDVTTNVWEADSTERAKGEK